MEGPQIKIKLMDLYEAFKAKGDKELINLVNSSLATMAELYQVDPYLVIPMTSEIIEKIKEEQKKFNPRAPYPPIIANNMSIQIVLPTKGKVGVCEYNQTVEI